MRDILVVQFARIGDILQSKRLLLSIAAEADVRVHLCVDTSLVTFASLVFPFAKVHGVPCHATTKASFADMFTQLQKQLTKLSAKNFERVYFLNASPLTYAFAALFPAGVAQGYMCKSGQPMRSHWNKLTSRLVRHRRSAPINLVDLWAYLHPDPIAPEKVNPIPRAAGTQRIGVVMAGRESRRSLPPPMLASYVQALFQAREGPEIVCIGTQSERPLVRQMARHLPAQTTQKIHDHTGATALTDLPELIQSLDLVFTPDTGAMHLAAHLGVPVHAIFLSSAWCFETGPYGHGHKVWQAVKECAPCIESVPCPYHVACRNAFEHPGALALLAGKYAKEWPDELLGCISTFDALGVCYSPVDGTEPRQEQRLALRHALMEHLGLKHGAIPPETGIHLYEEADWMLP